MALEKLQELCKDKSLEAISSIPKSIAEVFIFNVEQYKNLKLNPTDELQKIEKSLDHLRCSPQTVGHISYSTTHKIYFKNTYFNNKVTERKIAEYLKGKL